MAFDRPKRKYKKKNKQAGQEGSVPPGSGVSGSSPVAPDQASGDGQPAKKKRKSKVILGMGVRPGSASARLASVLNEPSASTTATAATASQSKTSLGMIVNGFTPSEGVGQSRDGSVFGTSARGASPEVQYIENSFEGSSRMHPPGAAQSSAAATPPTQSAPPVPPPPAEYQVINYLSPEDAAMAMPEPLRPYLWKVKEVSDVCESDHD